MGAVNLAEVRPANDPPRYALPQFADDAERLSNVWRFRVLKFLIVVSIAWFGCIVFLAVTSANPLVVSQPQINQSQVVVSAAIPAAESEVIVVERVWAGDVKVGEKLSVLQIHDTPAVQHARTEKQPADQLYIFPLTRFGRFYRITTLPHQTSAPIIYPVTPETIDQVKQALREKPR